MARKDGEHWSAVADEWIAWARAPNHDAFWAYRDSLLAFVGRGDGHALDVGCGEGRVARMLKGCGYTVTALDPVAAMVDAARTAQSADDYVIAAGNRLPFGSARFDLVMAYNVLMDVDDLPATLTEIARVLRPDGTLVISIVHPFTDHGRFADKTPTSPFVMTRDYFGSCPFEATEQRNDLRMHFAGWSRPLESYAIELENAGLAITALREPRPRTGDEWAHLQRWNRIPLFLWLKARRRGSVF